MYIQIKETLEIEDIVALSIVLDVSLFEYRGQRKKIRKFVALYICSL